MELNEVAKNLLAAILNVSPDKVAEMAESEEAEQQFKELNATNLKKRFDDGHKKGVKFSSKEYIAALKSSLDVDVSGESPEDIANSIKEALSDRDADDISEEAVKAHPLFKAESEKSLKLEQSFNKEVEKKAKVLVKEKETEFERKLKEAKRSGFLTEAEMAAEKWLTENNAILSPDPEKRKKQIKELAKKLDAYDLDKDEDGQFLISQGATPVLNKEGHNASLSDVFQEYDYLYNFQTVQQRQSTGINPNAPSSGNNGFKHYKGEVPKDEAGMNELRTKKLYGELTADAYKEVEAAYVASKTA
jgi:hypothetical protein